VGFPLFLARFLAFLVEISVVAEQRTFQIVFLLDGQVVRREFTTASSKEQAYRNFRLRAKKEGWIDLFYAQQMNMAVKDVTDKNPHPPQSQHQAPSNQMALGFTETCPKCGQTMTARQCPNCGFHMKSHWYENALRQQGILSHRKE